MPSTPSVRAATVTVDCSERLKVSCASRCTSSMSAIALARKPSLTPAPLTPAFTGPIRSVKSVTVPWTLPTRPEPKARTDIMIMPSTHEPTRPNIDAENAVPMPASGFCRPVTSAPIASSRLPPVPKLPISAEVPTSVSSRPMKVPSRPRATMKPTRKLGNSQRASSSAFIEWISPSIAAWSTRERIRPPVCATGSSTFLMSRLVNSLESMTARMRRVTTAGSSLPLVWASRANLRSALSSTHICHMRQYISAAPMHIVTTIFMLSARFVSIA